MNGFPRRIACLTEETTETLYLLGEQDRIVGVSGYTARPPEARLKPKISAFTTAKFEKIMAVEPDLVLAFSDLQADIVRELLRARRDASSPSISAASKRSSTWSWCWRGLSAFRKKEKRWWRSSVRVWRPSRNRRSGFPAGRACCSKSGRIPLISGIRWVEELIEIAGGEPVFPELRREQAAKHRIVDPQEVILRDPEVIIASWCGMKVNKDFIRARPGWDAIAAVRNDRIYEIKSTYILQPGPAALTEGVRRLYEIIAGSSERG